MSQLTQGKNKRVMYIENKEGFIGDTPAKIGWVTFSKTGQTIYYQDKSFKKIKGGGVSGNYYDEASGEEYWISGVKKRGSNAHYAEPVEVAIDDDAIKEYEKIIKG